MKPTIWDDIVGHEWAVDLLRRAVQNDRVGHAYLFAGPEQIGKTLLARTFAQALSCTHEPAGRPCGQCRACSLIAQDRHPDVQVVQPEISGRGKPTLKIEQVRELQQALALAPYEAPYKIAILKAFETATLGATNAFLKTLEEPPRHVKLFLTAQDADTLLATIPSRCRTVALRPVPTTKITQALVDRELISDEEEASTLAGLAAGRIGWAFQAAKNPDLIAQREAQINALHKVLNGRRVERFREAEILARKPDKLRALLQTWLSWWRDAALLSWHNETINNVDQVAALRDAAGKWTRPAVFTAWQKTDQAIRYLDQNANTRLVLENLFLVYPSASVR
jgi:DNA polymerase-3 subunit delta'